MISILELLVDDFTQVHSEKGKKLCICTYTLCHSSEIFGKSKTDSSFQTFNLPHTLKADFDSNIIDDPCERTPPTLGTEQYYIIPR